MHVIQGNQLSSFKRKSKQTISKYSNIHAFILHNPQ